VRGERPTLLSCLEEANLNQSIDQSCNDWLIDDLRNTVGVSFPSPIAGNKPSFRNVVFSSYLECLTMDTVQKPVILSVIHRRQNPLDSTSVISILVISKSGQYMCNYRNSGRYPSSCLLFKTCHLFKTCPLFKTWRFGDSILPPDTSTYLFLLGPTIYVPPEDGNKIRFPKLRVLNKRQDVGQCPELW
jgi:hypothetical protein